MKVRLYESVGRLPGDIHSVVSNVFLTKEILLSEEPDCELRDCLLAVLETNLPLTAHIYIDRNAFLIGGSNVRIVITTSSTDGSGIIWGTGYDPHPEGGPFVVSLHVDADLSKIAEEYKKEYKNKKKDFEGWKKFFSDIFETMRQEKLAEIESAQKLLPFLQPA